ncbi:dihydrofolate reductase family protein [Spongisporangium articulatum]|uniref:Dihydrofolate reductase family protein n=1 Tax=Spongisporangium articulatum TaxID=3362603 RepID=A0ABW8AIE4_9ACTN
MKLTTTTQVSVDGVMQGNGASAYDVGLGFERAGWATPHLTAEGGAYIARIIERADAFLFGRNTFDIFAPYWPTIEPGVTPIADAFNTRPKYLVTSRPDVPDWDGTTVLSGDVLEAVRELKAEPGGELQVHGSGALVRSLLEADLVDELTLVVVPVVVGGGARLFPETGVDVALELTESKVFPSGVAALTYRTAGRPTYGPAS